MAEEKTSVRIRLSAAEAETLANLQRAQEQHVASIAESRGFSPQGLYRVEQDAETKILYLVQVEGDTPALVALPGKTKE